LTFIQNGYQLPITKFYQSIYPSIQPFIHLSKVGNNWKFWTWINLSKIQTWINTKLNQKIWKNSYTFILLCYSSRKNFILIEWVVVEIKIPEIFNVEKTSQFREFISRLPLIQSRWNFFYSINIIKWRYGNFFRFYDKGWFPLSTRLSTHLLSTLGSLSYLTKKF